MCIGDVVTREYPNPGLFMPLRGEWVEGTGPDCYYDVLDLYYVEGEQVAVAVVCDSRGASIGGDLVCTEVVVHPTVRPWHLRIG